MNQWEIAKKALNQLEFQTGIIATVHAHPPLAHQDSINNAIISFDKSTVQLLAQYKSWGPEAVGRPALDSLLEFDNNKLLFSDYISDELGTQLRDLRCNYLDRAGNAFLDVASIFVLIQGKPPLQSTAMDRSARLFTDTGLKVVFALLTNAGLLNANYREIADHANVSMGTIGWVLRELKEQQFICEVQLTRSWKNRSRLVRMWAQAYPRLRSRFRHGDYCTSDEDWWKSLDLGKYQAVLGGEIAAISYTDLRRPTSGIIYVGKHKQDSLIRDLALRTRAEAEPHQSVPIEICSKFWGKTEDLSLMKNSTHPLLTYADLLDAWNPASRNIAKQIADRFFPG